MKALPKISIVIPSYNKVKYIQKTLESIFSQNYPKLEVIIQDGGSTDGTVKIIEKYATKHSKIVKWESKKDKGQTDAINKGFKKAIGDVLTFINADDVYEKGALNKVGEYFGKHPDILWLAGKGKTINENDKEISKWTTRYKNFLLKFNKYTFLLVVNYLFQPSVFLNKKVYRKKGPFRGANEVVMEYDLWLKLGKIEMPVILNNYLSDFRLTLDNISATQFNNVLSQDFSIARKHTGNPLILLLHYLHNLGRTIMICLIKICN